MTAQRVITSVGDKTAHYTGVGYQYFFSSDPQKGRTCKMQVPAAMLKEFETGVGRINSVNLPHLEILDQGNGWVLVCSDLPHNDSVVTHFIARFNKWALTRGNKPKPTPEPSLGKARYTIEVRTNDHGRVHRLGERLSSAQPVIAAEGHLRDLAETINARYGHTKRK